MGPSTLFILLHYFMKKLFLLFPLACLMLVSCEGLHSLNFGKQSTIVTHAQDTIVLTIPGASSFVWESDNDYIASASGDTLYVRYIGETTVHATAPDGRNGDIRVIVQPQQHILKEPILDATLTRDELIRQWGTPRTEQGDTLVGYFLDENPTAGTAAVYYYYIFRNGRMAQCQVQIREMEQALEFIQERYAFYTYSLIGQDPCFNFINALLMENASVYIQAVSRNGQTPFLLLIYSVREL